MLSWIDRESQVCLLAYVILLIVEPFHEGVIINKKSFRSFIFFRIRRTIVMEFVASKTDSSHLVEHESILLIVDRIKTFEHFSFINILIYVYVQRLVSFSGSFFSIFDWNNILAAVFDSTALSIKKVHFMEQTWNAVHFNYILDILFLTKALKSQLKFFVLDRPFANTDYTLEADIKTATHRGYDPKK